jgi:hypothetical protein
MESNEVLEKLKEISLISNKLGEFEKDHEHFLGVIKNLDEKYLRTAHEKFQSLSTDSKGKLKPVNFVKFIVLDRILKGHPISITKIDEIKSNIEDANFDYFKDYPDYKDAIKLLGKKKAFKVSELFRSC